MKKLLMGLGLIVLLAGCASRENDNGMGGTSDQYQQNQSTTSDQSTKTDSMNKDTSGNSTSSTAPNSNNGQP